MKEGLRHVHASTRLISIGLAVALCAGVVTAAATRAGAVTETVPYFLPYQTGEDRSIAQRPGARHSHNCPGPRCHAYDFGGEGWEVWASAGGTVQAIEDQGDGFFGEPVDANDGNFVRLRHADGTCTVYGQLAFDSVPDTLAVGQVVDVGTVLGLTGATGNPKIDDNTGTPVPALKFARTNCLGHSRTVAFVEGIDLTRRTTSQNPGVGAAPIASGDLVRSATDPATVFLAAGGGLFPVPGNELATFRSMYATTERTVPAGHFDLHGTTVDDGELYVELGTAAVWATAYGHRRLVGTTATHPGAWTVPTGGLGVVPIATAPSALPGLAAAWSGSDLWLGWLGPRNPGGTPITEFVVTVQPGGIVTRTPTTTAVVSGLAGNVTYTVSVVAVNAAGSGPASIITTRSGDPVAGRTGGYWMIERDGTVYGFGDAANHGGDGSAPRALATVPSGRGLWVLLANGQVRALEGATPFGGLSPSFLRPGEEPTSISVISDGSGYWIFTSLGRVAGFGAAAQRNFGDLSEFTLNGPVIASAATPSGQGYYMIGSDGGVFSFGDAEFHGSMGGIPLNQPVVGIAPDPDGVGYWLVAGDGGIFAFQAEFRGSMGGIPLNGPVVGAVAYADGYLMVASDGGIFNFSSENFFGSLGSNPPDTPILSVAAYSG